MKRNLVGLASLAAMTAAFALLAWAGPGEVERVFAEIIRDSHRPRAPVKQHRLSESDVNAYVALRLREEDPPGVEQILLGLREKDRIDTRMLVDVDELGLADQPGAAGWLASLMSGLQRLEFEGRLTSGDGIASYQIQSVRLNGIPIPVVLVESLLDSWGKRLQPPIDFSRPFALPYKIREIRIGQSQVTIRTGTDQGSDPGRPGV